MNEMISIFAECLGIPSSLVMASAAALMSIIGAATALCFKELANRWWRHAAIVSGLILLGVAILELSHHIFSEVHWVVLFACGALAMFVLDEIVYRFSRDEHTQAGLEADFKIVLLPLVALGLHSYLDGGIHALAASDGHLHDHHHHSDHHTHSAFEVSGLWVSIGLILHEFSEGGITAILALKFLKRPDLAFCVAIVVSALTTPIGALTALFAGEGFLELFAPFATGLVAAAGLKLVMGAVSFRQAEESNDV